MSIQEGCMNKKLVISAVFLMLSSLAVHAENGFYFETMLGNAEQVEKFDGFSDISGDKTSVGLRAGYNISNYIAVELGYHDFDEARDVNAVSEELIETSSKNLGVKISIPLIRWFHLNARLGAAEWDYKFKSISNTFVVSDRDDGVDLYYGLGVFFQISKPIGIGLEYTLMDHEANIEGFKFDREVNNLSLSVNYSL